MWAVIWLLGAVPILMVAGVLALAAARLVAVLPRPGLAPACSLVDYRGALVTSESLKGAITLDPFSPTCPPDCRRHDLFPPAMRARRRAGRPGAPPLRLVTLALGTLPAGGAPPSVERLTRDIDPIAAEACQAEGPMGLARAAARPPGGHAR
jgi:hypothetical protein